MNRTPDRWMRDTAWKHGPRRIVVSERPDPSRLIETNLPETAGEYPSPRRFRLLTELAFLLSATALLAALYLLADWLVSR